MDKILFISDIHGNMTAVRALEAQLQNIRPDQIWFLGDVVGKGPENDQAVDWVRTHCDHAIRGNWDVYVSNSYHKGTWPENAFYWKQIGLERLTWLESLPFESEILISGLWFRLIHGRPTDRLYYMFDSREEMRQGFSSRISDRHYDGYICADSHMPFFKTCSQGYAINTGSIGNSIGIPKVHCVLVEGMLGSKDPGVLKCEILSIPYDNAAAAQVIDLYPEAPNKEAYKKEILTGIYSR